MDICALLALVRPVVRRVQDRGVLLVRPDQVEQPAFRFEFALRKPGLILAPAADKHPASAICRDPAEARHHFAKDLCASLDPDARAQVVLYPTIV